jgi:CheY-like chemotaxis protein
MEDKTSVLIVDDNASFCKTISLVLKRKGYAVTTATGGQEAVKEVEKRPFDMIFIDIKMPEMNGVETYRKIKKIRPEIAAVMMTAYAVDDLIQEALEEGAYGIIHKPLDIDEAIDFLEWTKEAKKRGIVLVVDDDDGTCVTFRKILSRRGFKVSIVHSGEEAIAMMKVKTHDILFIDMKLPNKHGLET